MQLLCAMIVALMLVCTGCSSKQPAPPKYGCEGMLLSKFDRLSSNAKEFASYLQQIAPQKAVVVMENMSPNRGGKRMTIAIKEALKNKGMKVLDAEVIPETQDEGVLYVHPLCLRKTGNGFDLRFMTVTRFTLNGKTVTYDLMGIGRYEPNFAEGATAVVTSIVMPFACAGQMASYRLIYGERAAEALRESYEDFLDGTYTSQANEPVTTCVDEM